jgi:methylenetetrahydrofolate dehydrogenase (NADP+)/methenyltetrahydrofolate cyclohydrolase
MLPEAFSLAARILDGKALAETIKDQVASDVAQIQSQTGRVPGLTVVLVGDNPASQVYVRNKQNACKAVGIRGTLLRLPAEIDENQLYQHIHQLNNDPDVHGILVQLPLPGQIHDRKVIEWIDPRKDVDGFHPENAGLLAIGHPRFVPCTPLGIRELLIANGIATQGAHVVVLGRSQIVGKSMALLLLMKGIGGDATVTVCHSASRDVEHFTRQADLLIAAIGRAESVKGDAIKPGAVVIDVGMNRRTDGSLCGDVDFATASEVASWITPVPGGVGPMTVAMLLRNTLDAFRNGE